MRTTKCRTSRRQFLIGTAAGLTILPSARMVRAYEANDRLNLEIGNGSTEDLTPRVIDLAAPIGKGQRGLIVSPPKAGKTMMLQSIAHSIEQNHPECYLMVLLKAK